MEFVPLLLALSGPAQADELKMAKGTPAAREEVEDVLELAVHQLANDVRESCVDVRFSTEPGGDPLELERKDLSRDEWTFAWGEADCTPKEFGPFTCDLSVTSAKKRSRGKGELSNTSILRGYCVTPDLADRSFDESRYPTQPDLSAWESTLGLR